MTELLNHLLELQSLEFGDVKRVDSDAEIERLRALIPSPILGHYDRLTARGKRGVALVEHDVCTGCHMRLPIGTINTLLRATDLQLCENCGRYLALSPEPLSEPAEPPVRRQVPANRSSSPRCRRSRTKKLGTRAEVATV